MAWVVQRTAAAEVQADASPELMAALPDLRVSSRPDAVGQFHAAITICA